MKIYYVIKTIRKENNQYGYCSMALCGVELDGALQFETSEKAEKHLYGIMNKTMPYSFNIEKMYELTPTKKSRPKIIKMDKYADEYSFIGRESAIKILQEEKWLNSDLKEDIELEFKKEKTINCAFIEELLKNKSLRKVKISKNSSKVMQKRFKIVIEILGE